MARTKQTARKSGSGYGLSRFKIMEILDQWQLRNDPSVGGVVGSRVGKPARKFNQKQYEENYKALKTFLNNLSNENRDIVLKRIHTFEDINTALPPSMYKNNSLSGPFTSTPENFVADEKKPLYKKSYFDTDDSSSDEEDPVKPPAQSNIDSMDTSDDSSFEEEMAFEKKRLANTKAPYSSDQPQCRLDYVEMKKNLPDNFSVEWSKTNQRFYFYNKDTGQSSWVWPPKYQ